MNRSAIKYVSDEEIYEIRPCVDLADLLRDGHALCLVWRPSWNRLSPELHQVRGRFEDRDDLIYCATDEAKIQSATKNRLDCALEVPYLFVPWHQDTRRVFRIVLHGKVLQEYSTMTEAVSALIPGRFVPSAIYRRKCSIAGVMLLQARRRRDRQILCKRLLELLNYLKQRKE